MDDFLSLSKARPLQGIHFASISSESDAQLSSILETLGGTIDFCRSYQPHEQLQQQRKAKKLAADFANRLLTAEIDFVLFTTAVGLNYLVRQALSQVDRERFLGTLSDVVTIAGSERVAQAFRCCGVEPTIVVEQPASWRDLLVTIDNQARVSSFTIGLEESEFINSLTSGIEARGGRVHRIPIFPQIVPAIPAPAQRFFEQLDARDFSVLLFCNPEQVIRYCFLCKNYGRARSVAHSLDYQIVVAIGEDTAEILTDRQIPIDHTSPNSNLQQSIPEIADHLAKLTQRKQIAINSLSGPATTSSDPQAPWYDSPFMKACRGEVTDVTPIWMMRQAGRYMAEYRAVRDKVGFLELCANPQLCSEVMCTAVNRLGVDAAIIFSDLLPMLVPMGMELEFSSSDGPIIHNPIRTAKDLNRVRRLETAEEMSFVMETVTQTRNDLPEDIPLIGFAGAPFTLASYMIEGGSSRNYANTKKFLFTDAGAWQALMHHLTHSLSVYLNGQISAGAQCVQIFDSWAGCLAFEDYQRFVHPYVKRLIDSIPAHVPVINFATGNPSLLPLLADTRATVIGIDWRVRLDEAWETVGFERSVQGNLDPTVLLTNPQEIRRRAKFILDLAADRPGHIFNLGHGILPQTPVENAIALVDAVHELSQN